MTQRHSCQPVETSFHGITGELERHYGGESVSRFGGRSRDNGIAINLSLSLHCARDFSYSSISPRIGGKRTRFNSIFGEVRVRIKWPDLVGELTFRSVDRD